MMKRFAWIMPAIIGVLVIFFFSMCAPRNNEVSENKDITVPSEDRQLELQTINRRELPDEVSGWLNNSLRLYATGYADTKEYNGKTYIFITRGERPTGGYDVRILDAIPREDHVEIRVRFTRPAPDVMVTQAITYPHDIAALNATNITVRFTAEGNDRPSRITRLEGIDSLKDIVASSRLIKIFEPAPRAETGRTVSLSGVALLPEKYISYQILDHEGTVKNAGETNTASSLEWGYFETQITVPGDISDGSEYQLVLLHHDADKRESDRLPIRLKLRE